MRSGFVLLVALAILVLVLAATTSAILVGRFARAAAAAHEIDLRLGDGLAAGERLALAWMRSGAAATAVAPADGSAITIVNDRCRTSAGRFSVQVDAYDVLGMVPPNLLVGGGRLRQAVPGSVVHAVAAIPPGHRELLDLLEPAPGARVFPHPGPAPADRYGDPDGGAEPIGPELAETIATWTSPWAEPRININTAPPAILHAAFAELGLDGARRVLDERRAGRRSVPPAANPGAGIATVALADASDRWAFLIAVRWGERQRAWWVIAIGNAGTVRIVQRHAADH
jgi:hypothetical protein